MPGSIILNELTGTERIYAVKPVNDRWLGRLPQNLFEVADMQTEFWMESLLPRSSTGSSRPSTT